MKRFFYCMAGPLGTAAAFLLILSFMVSASMASVRAEERMENRTVIETVETMAEKQETNGYIEVKEQTQEQITEEITEEIITEEITENEPEELTEGNGESATPSDPLKQSDGGENGIQYEEKETETDREEVAEDAISDQVPIGRKLGKSRGTASVVSGIMPRSMVGSNCRIRSGTRHYYGTWETSEFEVLTDKGRYMGYCAQPNKPDPTETTYQVAELENDRIKMALMFGADGPWSGEASKLCGGAADPYPYIHAMIGVTYNESTEGLTEEQIQGMKAALDQQMNEKKDLSIFQEYKAYVAYTEGQDIVWLEYEGPVNGNIKLCKSSSNSDVTDGNACYSLGGAEYGIYADPSCTTRSGQFTTNDSGESDLVELAEGDYWVKELTAPKGYRRDLQVYPIHVKAGEDQQMEVVDVPEYDSAGLELVKRDQETESSPIKDGASLAGTQFTVRYYNGHYNKENLPQAPTRTWVLETKGVPDATGAPIKYQALLREEYKVSGDAFYMMDGIPVLPLGTLVIEETKAPQGYLLEGAYLQAEGSAEKITDPYITQICQKGDGTALKGGNKYAMYNQVLRGGVKIRKRDYDTKATVPQGSALLTNAVFAVVSLNENAVIVEGKVYAQNETITKISTDDNGIAQTQERLLPYGKYRIVETGAPTGYLDQGIWRQEFFITKNNEIVDLTDTEHSIQNRVMRGDFELRKIDANTQKVMPDVTFSLTSVTTGESHIVTTDENGYYSSSSDWNKHTENTNQGGTQDGLWFGLDGNGGSAPVDDTLGALPYDTYILEELPTEANEGKEMLQIPFVIYKNKVTVDLGNLENKDIYESKPSISTNARNEATGNHYAEAGTVTIIDSVLYDGLKEQQEYLLKCTVIDKDTEEPLADKSGNTITAEQTFTPAASAGIVEVECTFDASELAGKDIVLYEELYENDRKTAEHKDPGDESQTIHFPKIGTRAMDKSTGANTIVAGENVSIADTVSYKNLKPGQEYTLRGKLIDKETGMIAKDAAGGDITAEVKFTPKEKDGTVEVIFTFDASNQEGKTLVAFETLEKNSKIYAVHADIDSEEQTICFPKVRTSAKDVGTDSRNARPAEDTVVVDTVFYSNLTPGQEYTVEGTLMDKETESPIQENGENITAKTTFTPESDSGTVDVTFSFDSSDFAGKTAVAFESVTQEGEEIAVHKDIHYEGQTIYFPEISTCAAEKTSGSKTITAQSEITILDKITYKNLIPGEEYTIKGILMDKFTGTPFLIEETQITAEKTFVPDEKDGTTEVEFNFNASALKSADIVVFEKLFIGDSEIAVHEDLNDESQTVQINMPQAPAEDKPAPAEPEKAVKTGDPANVVPAVLLLILSMLVLIASARKKLG